MQKAMVVDDSRAMRMILARALAGSGFDVHEEADGRAALDYLGRGQGCPELILVDWNMPEMTGLEFIRAVRRQPQFRQVRLLMVTTETEIEQMERALAAGADEYLMKPFVAEDLRNKLVLLGVIE